jgi:hypothetical protein
MSGTVQEWLQSRTPVPPSALRERVEQALRATGPSGGDASVAGGPGTAVEREIHVCCLTAASTILRPLLAHEGAGREAALDLLAADALVTYAFEAASTEPHTLDDRAGAAMRAIAALAVPGAPPSSALRSIARG